MRRTQENHARCIWIKAIEKLKKKKVSTLQTNQYQKHQSTQQSIPRTLFRIEFNPVQET